MASRGTKVIAKGAGNNVTVSEGEVARFDVVKLIYQRKHLFGGPVRQCDIKSILNELQLSYSESEKVEGEYSQTFFYIHIILLYIIVAYSALTNAFVISRYNSQT